MMRPVSVHVGVSPTAQGGIASVLAILRKNGFFSDAHVLLISSGIGGRLRKIAMLVKTLTGLFWWVGIRRVRIVHLHVAAYNSFWRKSLFLLVAHGLGARVVLHWHSPRLKEFMRELKPAARRRAERIFHLAVAVVSVSEASRHELMEMIPGLKPVVIYNPVDSDLRQVGPDALRSNSTILFMAALLPEKGIFDLLDAFEIVRRIHPGCRLVMCGAGRDAELADAVRTRGLAHAVELPGWVSGLQRQEQFDRAAVFCLPSRADTFAMANLDAMSAGLPVVSTRHGGIPEVVEDGQTGLLVEVGDNQELAAALVRLLSDPELRVLMGANGARVARERFSYATMHARLQALYLDVVTTGRGPDAR